MWKTLADNGLPSLDSIGNARPHLTVAVYDSVSDKDMIQNAVKTVCQSRKPFNITFTHLGLFTVNDFPVFLSTPLSDPLYAVNTVLHEACDKFSLQKWPYYSLGEWVPHCTLAICGSEAEAGEVVQCAAALFKPFTARAERIGIAEFYPITYWDEWTLQ